MSKLLALRCESCAALLTTEKYPLICRFCGAENWGKDSFSFSEQRAVANLRLLQSAEITFSATFGGGNCGSAKELFLCGLIPPSLAEAAGVPKMQNEAGTTCEGNNQSLAGYLFQLETFPRSTSAPANFNALALISSNTKREIWNFYVDETGLIRFSRNPHKLPDSNSAIFDVNFEQTLG